MYQLYEKTTNYTTEEYNALVRQCMHGPQTMYINNFHSSSFPFYFQFFQPHRKPYQYSQ